MLVTCAKDKIVKVWQFPPQWIDETGVEGATMDVTVNDGGSGPPSSNLNTFPNTHVDGRHYDSIRAEQMQLEGSDNSSEEVKEPQEQSRPVKMESNARADSSSSSDDLGGWDN